MEHDHFPVRRSWGHAPERLRREVSRLLQAPVAGTLGVNGGMSPGPAGILALADGRYAFAKAVSAAVNAHSHALYEWEATALAALPTTVPAPRLLGVVHVDSWIAVVTSRIAGHTAGPPWTSDAVRAVADACDRVAEHAAPHVVPPVIERLPDLDGWTRLARGTAGPLDDWENRHVAELAAIVEGWRDWTAGSRLTHLDLRCDNAIVGAAGAALVDWGYCSAGAPWLDRALLAADIVGAGHVHGPPTALRLALEVLALCPDEAARFVIAQAGMWRHNSTLPPHPGLPTHRAWQRARARALRPLVSSLIETLASTCTRSSRRTAGSRPDAAQ